jgi:serine/threonine protein phosphatase PrpC
LNNRAAAGVRASAGFFSSGGPREANEDFAGVVFGSELSEPRVDVIAVIADGIGGAKGGRIAAETAVRGFLDGFCDLPDTMEVRRAAAKIVSSLNAWIYAQGRNDPNLRGMGTTFTALVLRGRLAHVLHVGDTRAYRLSADRLTCLTQDNTRTDGSGRNLLTRALGVETEVLLDYASQPIALHDRLLLLSDGIHGILPEEAIAEILRTRSAPQDTARALVAAALKYGSADNCTALVLDVVALQQKDSAELGQGTGALPLLPTPIGGETIDGFVLKNIISDGRYTRLFAATDEGEGGEVVLKFPKPSTASDQTFRAAFTREAFVGQLAKSPWLARVIELTPGRQSALYIVMPLYGGELLETRLQRAPAIGMEEGRDFAIKLARAATSLHRGGIIHRDIKPDNVMLEGNGQLKLLDFGVVRIRGQDDFQSDIPGTRAYMAPEMLKGEKGNEATDIFALGVTMFRCFTGEFPYANADAVSPPRRERTQELTLLRPDLPAWLQATINRALTPDPADRFQDMMEFAVEMESGPSRSTSMIRRPRTLYERAPLKVWQGLAALLAFALLVSLVWR